MRLTTKGRYAVTAMMDLALNDERTSGRNREDNSADNVEDRVSGNRNAATGSETLTKIALSDIAANQDISLSYLEQLFAKLRRHGLVEGVRGPGGGYRLARPAGSISVADIVTAVDEVVDVTRCAGRENCQDGERCLAHELWSDLSQKVFEFLDGITLGELVSQPRTREVAKRQAQRRVDVELPGLPHKNERRRNKLTRFRLAQ